LSAGIIRPSQNMRVLPDEALTRGDLAIMLYRKMLYRDGAQVQTLLSRSENALIISMRALEQQNLQIASLAAANALITARGALNSSPDEKLAKAGVKLGEGIYTLTEAYRLVDEGNITDAVSLAGTAWHLAAKAREFSGTADALANSVQEMAADFAENVRSAGQ